MKVAVLFSGGKDSTYAAWLASKEHEIACLVTVESENTESYMFHTPNIGMAKIQAQCMEIPLEWKLTKGVKEDELSDLADVINRSVRKYGIKGIVSGAIESSYQKTRIEKICSGLNLDSITPVWKREPEKVLKDMIENGFEIMITAVGAEGLGKEWLGRIIDANCIHELSELGKQTGIHIAGEGGEFETIVTDCPLFRKRLVLLDYEKVWDGKTRSGYMAIRRYETVEKP